VRKDARPLEKSARLNLRANSVLLAKKLAIVSYETT
jgi:hypothetical protein